MMVLDRKPGVLVVDDDRYVRLMLQSVLQSSGFCAWLACNGLEAIERYQAERERIAVVLLDVRMPLLDGPQTLDALHEINPDVVACFMSGDPGNYESDDLLRRGAARFFVKPFDLEELTSSLWCLVQDMPAVAAVAHTLT